MSSSIYSYRFSPIAEQDIDSTLSYISEQLCNNKASNDLYAKIEDTINNICAFPRSSHDCKCYLINDENIRCSLVNNYALIYEIIDDKHEIHILRFVYAKRDLMDLTIK